MIESDKGYEIIGYEQSNDCRQQLPEFFKFKTEPHGNQTQKKYGKHVYREASAKERSRQNSGRGVGLKLDTAHPSHGRVVIILEIAGGHSDQYDLLIEKIRRNFIRKNIGHRKRRK